MFDEGGSLDPTLKLLLYAVLTLAAGKMLWEWLTEDVTRWITVDLWGLIADHPWWTSLIAASGLLLFLLLGKLLSFLLDADIYVGPDDTCADTPDNSADPDVLTFKMKQLSAMSATGFEQACADLLARDGFRSPRRVGGAGDSASSTRTQSDQDTCRSSTGQPACTTQPTCPS
ncbi:hypothetical protein SAZ11_62320 [Streptomyces sp. FXJ1.4098]|uniref:hypothetical protein n=1 Tax=Streptomyces sp. NPDC020845 TaxID=3365096 RepID=UPI00299853FC|nr:hypothetical protein [Streptomyces sp. FXJ1.4098]